MTICLIGSTTSGSTWVEWEIKKSVELGNKIMGVRLSTSVTHTVPRALKEAGATIIGWDIDKIVKEIG